MCEHFMFLADKSGSWFLLSLGLGPMGPGLCLGPGPQTHRRPSRPRRLSPSDVLPPAVRARSARRASRMRATVRRQRQPFREAALRDGAALAALRRTRLKQGADEYQEPPRAPGCCPVPYASMGSAIKTGRSRRGISKVMIFLHHSGASEESLGRMKSDFFA